MAKEWTLILNVSFDYLNQHAMTEEEKFEFEKRNFEVEKASFALEREQFKKQIENSIQFSNNFNRFMSKRNAFLTLGTFIVVLALVFIFEKVIFKPGESDKPVNSVGKVMYKRLELESLLYGKPREFVVEILGKPDQTIDYDISQKRYYIYHHSTYLSVPTNPDNDLSILFTGSYDRGTVNIIRFK